MNEVIHSGHHPDAEQIGAFVEHALPAHEREWMLEHLSVCRECRAVVALSLPPVEEQAKPADAAHGGFLWPGWIFAWPVAAVLASLAIFAVYLHHSSTASQVPAANQIANSNQPAPQSPIGQLAPTSAKQPASEPEQAAAASLREAAGHAAAEVANRSDGAAFRPQSEAASTFVGDSGPEVSQLRKAAPIASGGSVGAGGYGAAPKQAVAGNELQQKVQLQSEGKIAAATPRVMANAIQNSIQLNQAVPAAAPAKEAESLSMDRRQAAMQNAQLKHPLPSRLPVLSMANQTHGSIAIDTSNTVYLSKDEGKHWKPVQAQWRGRAVNAAVVEAQTADLKMEKKTAAGEAFDAYSLSNRSMSDASRNSMRMKANASGPSITGKVTDATGAAIPGVAIAVKDATGNAVQWVKTDAMGRYAANSLAPGSYKLVAEARGFERQQVAAIVVEAGRSAVADLSLRIGAETETVTVEALANAAQNAGKSKAKRSVAPNVPALFEITTENGEHWTSADGVTWSRTDAPRE